MTAPKTFHTAGPMSRRALLGALPVIPAIPLLASSPAQSDPGEEKPDKNQPVYKATPHIEAFYEKSRF